MARAKEYVRPDAKKLDALKKLHEKNATLKAKHVKAREDAIKANEHLREVVAERQALADEITAAKTELLAGGASPQTVTEACCTPDAGGKSKKE